MPAGRRVLIPRIEGSADTLVDLVTAAGADPVAVPLLTIGPPNDEGALDAAVLGLAAGEYSWVGFASTHGVAAVLARGQALGLTPLVPADTRIAAVGAATAAALRAAGLPVDLLPVGAGSGAALAATWPHPTGPARVLLPASEIGLTTLAELLRDKGYEVYRVAAYAPRARPLPSDIAAALCAGDYAAVLLTSPSLTGIVADGGPPPGVRMVAIGGTTAAAAADRGLTVAAVAAEPTPAGLVAALLEAVDGLRPAPTPPRHPPEHHLSRNETP